MSALMTSVRVAVTVKDYEDLPEGYDQDMVIETVMEVLADALAGATERLSVFLVCEPLIC